MSLDFQYNASFFNPLSEIIMMIVTILENTELPDHEATENAEYRFSVTTLPV
jgi:hypothetical protein